MITTENIVKLLEELHTADPEVAKKLVEVRFPCNAAVANHPTLVVAEKKGKDVLGMLGLLNAIVAEDDKLLQALYSEDGDLLGFRSVAKPVK